MALYARIKKEFGSFTLDTEFEAKQEVLGILGESGCGKSMTLQCIAGFIKPDEGRIELNGRVLFDSQKRINEKPQRRKVGYLFQNYALFPNMTVQQNLMMGLKASKKGKEECRKQIQEMMERFYLSGLEAHRPHQLSGGQQQRTALARLLLSKPEIVLLDEPFSALDEFLRWKLELELAEVLKEYGGSVLFVSHNRDEIYRMCDRVCVMNRGKSSPVVTVKELFQSPDTRAAAYLSGCKNFSAAVPAGKNCLYASDWGIHLWKPHDPGTPFTSVGIRSHSLTPCDPEKTEKDERQNVIRCRIKKVIEDVFAMIIMAEPLENMTGQRQDLRMEISKEVWRDYCNTHIDGKEIGLLVREEDIMLLR